MFYGLFNSGTGDYRLHRSFILRLILDGLHDEQVHPLSTIPSLLVITQLSNHVHHLKPSC
jgi:hypothetical protein